VATAAEPRRPEGPRRRIPGAYTLAFWRDPIRSLETLAREHGDVVHWTFGGTDAYLLKDPDHIRRVLVADHRAFMKGRALQVTKRVLGEGLLTSEGDFHDVHRRVIQPLFHADRIREHAGAMAAAAARARDRRRERETIDIQREMARVTLAIVGETLFSTDLEPEADEISEALTASLDGLNLFMLPHTDPLERLPLPPVRRFHAARRRLDDTIARLLDERRTSGVERADLVSVLLAAERKEGWSRADLRDEAMTILLAGHETTASALTWTWWLLARHPEAEAKLHEELDRVLAGRLPTADDLPRLGYADMVVSESMRLFPPAWLLGRRVLVDYDLDGYRFARGSIVILSPYVTHRDPRFYPDPLAFDPDRWTPAARRSRPRYAYFPFGGGPRVCIGEAFARTEAILVLATLAQAWRFRPPEEYEPRLHPRVTLRPKGGMPMKLELRRARTASRG
jgi:cytochrome P450